MISVVITTYNRPEKLKKAIDSVHAQTFTDWELVVVHDEEGTDEPVHKFVKHTGIHAIPKNYGTRLAKGEYIAYLDDDNTWRPDHLQILYNAMKAQPELDLVYGDRWLHDEGGEIPDQIGICSDYNPQALLVRNYIDTSDFLVKKQALIDIGGWDERWKRLADWNLVVRLAKNGVKMKRVQVIITDYNFSKDSLGHTPDPTEGWNAYELEVDLPYLHEVKEPKVAVFTVIHKDDDLPILQKCFSELHKRMGYPFFHLFILNGTLPKTKKWLEECNSAVDDIIENKKNMGIAAACNQAVDYLKYWNDKDFDIIWKIDGDCLFLTDDIGKTLVELYNKNHMMIWSPYPEGLIDNAGGAPRIDYGTLGGHLIGITQHIGGFCQFIPAKARIACRLPDTKILHYMEDLFMSQGVAKLGYGIAYVEDIRVRHVLKP